MILKRSFLAAVFLGALGFNQIARAELAATPLPGDSRLVQFEYDADQTYLVLTRPKAVTHIEFAADETVMTVAGGDTKHWEITPTGNRKHVFIKPIYDSIETSMTVITDKRSYQFVLRSTGAGAKWYQRVTWRHGNTMLLDLGAHRPLDEGRPDFVQRQPVAANSPEVNPQNLRFGYTVSGEAEFRPVAVFDDGRFTWIKMPDGLQEMPALFEQVDGGDFQLINYLVKDRYLVAQQVMASGVLKLGRAEVKFSRTAHKPSFARSFYGD